MSVKVSWAGTVVLLLALFQFEGALAHKKRCPKKWKPVCDIKKCRTYWNICYAKKYHVKKIKGGKCTWKKCHPKPPPPKKSPLPPVTSPKKSPLPSPYPSPLPSPYPSPLPSPKPSPRPSPHPPASPKKSPYPPVTECKKIYKDGKLVKKVCCQKFYEHGKVAKKVCWYYDEWGKVHKGL